MMRWYWRWQKRKAIIARGGSFYRYKREPLETREEVNARIERLREKYGS